MCGRFTLTVDASELQQEFPWINIPNPEIQPRYNIAPTQPVAVVANDGHETLDYYTWGLIPSWAKDPKIGSRMINARSETLSEKPSFRNAFKRRRCIILADGFYEWLTQTDKKSKIPMYIRLLDQRPFAFAGLWEQWFSPDGSEIRSCTIITTEPNDLIGKIHNRMPVILQKEVINEWLKTSEADLSELSRLLIPFPADQMVAFPVSFAVNNPNIDLPKLIDAV